MDSRGIRVGWERVVGVPAFQGNLMITSLRKWRFSYRNCNPSQLKGKVRTNWDWMRVQHRFSKLVELLIHFLISLSKKNWRVDNAFYGLIGINGQILDVMEATVMEVLPSAPSTSIGNWRTCDPTLGWSKN